MNGQPSTYVCSILALICLFGHLQRGLAQFPSINQAYDTTNASQLTNTGDITRIVRNVFLPNQNNDVEIQVRSTIRFDQIYAGFNGTYTHVTPKQLSFVYPWCVSRPPTFSPPPPGPNGCTGKTYYGRYNIPSSQTGFNNVPDNSSVVNGVTAMNQILGNFIPATDQGTLPYYGVVTWVADPSCPVNVSTAWLIGFDSAGLFDIGDPTPIEYCESATGKCLWLTSYGLGCTSQARSPNSPRFSPQAVVVPVCRMYTPNNFLDTTPANVDLAFGPNYNGPLNLNPNAVVYMIRIDNLIATYYVQYYIKLIYMDGSNDVFKMETEFNTIEYFASAGKTPALLYFCTGNSDNCTLPSTPAFNEVQLGYLVPCNCGPTNTNTTGNVVCGNNPSNNGTVLLQTPIPRLSIPFFSNPGGFQPSPVCAIGFATNLNSSNPVQNVPFSIISGSFGGLAPLQYAWRWINTPQSTAVIQPPVTTQLVIATVFAPGSYTIQQTVTGANGFSATCQLNIFVDAGQPVACLQIANQTTANILYVAIGESVSFDASCSTNPLGTPLTFGWIGASFFNTSITGLPFSISTNSGPSMTLSGLFPGSGTLYLNVTNEITNAWKVVYIYVVPMTVPSSAPYAPFVAPLPPTTQCFVPGPNTTIPWLVPSTAPPLGNLPTSPNSPMSVNPSGSSPFSGLLSPAAYLPEWVGITGIILIVTIIVFLVLMGICLRAAKRRRRLDRALDERQQLQELGIVGAGANTRNRGWFGQTFYNV